MSAKDGKPIQQGKQATTPKKDDNSKGGQDATKQVPKNEKGSIQKQEAQQKGEKTGSSNASSTGPTLKPFNLQNWTTDINPDDFLVKGGYLSVTIGPKDREHKIEESMQNRSVTFLQLIQTALSNKNSYITPVKGVSIKEYILDGVNMKVDDFLPRLRSIKSLTPHLATYDSLDVEIIDMVKEAITFATKITIPSLLWDQVREELNNTPAALNSKLLVGNKVAKGKQAEMFKRALYEWGNTNPNNITAIEGWGKYIFHMYLLLHKCYDSLEGDSIKKMSKYIHLCYNIMTDYGLRPVQVYSGIVAITWCVREDPVVAPQVNVLFNIIWYYIDEVTDLVSNSDAMVTLNELAGAILINHWTTANSLSGLTLEEFDNKFKKSTGIRIVHKMGGSDLFEFFALRKKKQFGVDPDDV